jgi:hypothetical protein
MPILPGGDVIPSFLGIERTPPMWSGHNFDNGLLRFGEVQEIIYPNDKRSQSKRYIEYNVLVQQRSNGTGTSKLYQNVAVANLFGGIADRFEYILRPAVKNEINKSGLGKGSKVLILCANGETNTSFIIGGLHDQNQKVDNQSKDLGHYCYFNFNGVSAYIDKDGQFLLKYGGATDADGKTDVNKKERGTRIEFLKDGSWSVNTRDPNDPDNTKEQFMFLDHKNHNTVHQAKNKWTVQVKGEAQFKADKGVKLNDATDLMMLGESFRKAQRTKNTNLQADLQVVSNSLQTAAQTMINAVSSVDASLLAAVKAAGAAVLIAAQYLDRAAADIRDFEQKAASKNSFLSQKHKLD